MPVRAEIPDRMDPTTVRERAADLPAEPGVYRFEAGDGTALYVGKAVDLRDRVRSYADPRSERVARMVERAAAIDHSVTETETQALLLEANLIKRHRPRYNVRLKDDKSYPMVQLTDGEVPRIEITRDPDGAATVFGPYTHKGRVETVVTALRKQFGVRGCSDRKYRGRERPCLDHEMGLCTAPCTGEIEPEAYLADVRAVRRFLDGETGALADPLRREMEAAAANREFERAANLRDRLEAVESFHDGGGDAVHAGDADATDPQVDVLGAAREGSRAHVARLRAADGKLVDRERHALDAPDAESGPGPDDEPAAARDADHAGGTASLLAAFLTQYYAERALPDALLLPERPADPDVRDWLEGEGVDVRVPAAGREATLVDLAVKNARTRGGRSDEAGALADALGIDPPETVEGVDVSHAGGTAVVGANVRFRGGDPEKAGYRRRKLPDRNDDYASMRELVRWRADRAVAGRDDRSDPDLLVVDGGEGQLRAARDALAAAGWDVPAVALAKGDELIVTSDGVRDPPDDAPGLHLLQRVRDEAHRFAVQYHTAVRDEVSTPLDDLDGVGPALRRRLLRRFGSVDGVRAASEVELREVEGIGPATAGTIARSL